MNFVGDPWPPLKKKDSSSTLTVMCQMPVLPDFPSTGLNPISLSKNWFGKLIKVIFHDSALALSAWVLTLSNNHSVYNSVGQWFPNWG